MEVLRVLRGRGIATGLVSNWDTSCRSVLEQTGLAPYLDPIVVSSEVGVEKPDRRIFEKALELSGDSPEHCLYVGDNYYDDGVGASQVGMEFCILNPPWEAGHGRAGFDLVRAGYPGRGRRHRCAECPAAGSLENARYLKKLCESVQENFL